MYISLAIPALDFHLLAASEDKICPQLSVIIKVLEDITFDSELDNKRVI